MRMIGLAMAVSVLGFSAVAEDKAEDTERYNGYEVPAYTVLDSEGSIELRDYAPHIVAEVTVEGSRRQAASKGFRLLANYIFGGNTTAAKVAMTAPVTQSEPIAMTAPVTQSGAGDTWTVRFAMPSSYTLETLPKPKNSAVTLFEVDPGTRLVIRFAGRALTRSLTQYKDRLQSYAKLNGLTLTGGPEYAYYDDPFTLPWRRRNEVSFSVVPATN